MAYYGGVWKTNKVSVELKTEDDKVILERARGSKNTKKRIMIDIEKMAALLEAIAVAYKEEPITQVTDIIPIGFVDGGCASLRVEWGPYWFGRANALMISAQTGQCLAIEQEDLHSFCHWLLGQWISITGFQNIDLA